jgi:CRISPR system Cascade subunit CasA
MPFNLLCQPWLPLRRRDGAITWAAPSAIAEPDVTGIAWPRADFSLAAQEWLIGLLATAFAPESEEAWHDAWRAPPSRDALAAAFAPFAAAFELDGEGARFGQDFEDLPGEPGSPETLLIEAPGEAALKKNTALLVKPGRVARLSRAAAAIALHTLQTYAPSGGRGNLTSLRGGGPLSTLVIPGDAPSLWELLWANVPERHWDEPIGPDPAVFPWMAPTRTSEKGRTTSPAETHVLQAFWGMPRRVRLDFVENPARASCDLGGPADDVQVTGWRQRPYGVKYVGWEHPLSPYYEGAKGSGWLPVHPQPGGIGYRHWLALVVGEAGRRPARNVAAWRNGRAEWAGRVRQGRVLAAGYDMDNMKARSFVESEMPLPGTARPAIRQLVDAQAERLVQGADAAAGLLRGALREALAAEGDATVVQSGLAAFWGRTEQPFFETLRATIALQEREDAPDLLPGRLAWRNKLRDVALSVFRTAVPLDRAFAKPVAAGDAPPREIAALRGLTARLEGYQPSGAAFFEALGLAAPEPATGKRRRKSTETP